MTTQRLIANAKAHGPETPTRCPYCVENSGFKVMIPYGGGDWFMCARCGHLALPANRRFVCTCARCVGLKIA